MFRNAYLYRHKKKVLVVVVVPEGFFGDADETLMMKLFNSVLTLLYIRPCKIGLRQDGRNSNKVKISASEKDNQLEILFEKMV